MDLSKKRDRVRLAERREPYWQRLFAGAFLGFRRGPDTWIVRYRRKGGEKQKYKALPGAIEFDEAKRAAEEWLSTLTGTAVRSVKRDSVQEALKRYLKDLRTHGRHDAADEAEGRFKLTVFGDPEKGKPADGLADLSLESATRDDFEEWRERLRLDKKGKPRQPRSINRHVRSVVAGLNKAHELGYVGKPEAWKLSPLADSTEDEGDTAVFLDSRQRKVLLAVASPNAADFLRALELTGARPKEIAQAVASDFDGKALKLSHKKGKPPKTRVRYVYLDATAVDFFARMVKNKLPKAPIFTEDGQTPWRRHVWAREVRVAIPEANRAIAEANRTLKHEKRIPGISADATAYSFRHARISELLQIHRVDPLTVAAQCGTSLAMIEKAYLKFIPSAMAEKLAAVEEA